MRLVGVKEKGGFSHSASIAHELDDFFCHKHEFTFHTEGRRGAVWVRYGRRERVRKVFVSLRLKQGGHRAPWQGGNLFQPWESGGGHQSPFDT